MKKNEPNSSNEPNYENSKALFVLKIVTLSFGILASVVFATVMLTRWISDINRVVKESKTKLAKAKARLNKFKKERIKHILKLRKLHLKEEKENKKYTKKHGTTECECEEVINDDELENEFNNLENLENLDSLENLDNLDNLMIDDDI